MHMSLKIPLLSDIFNSIMMTFKDKQMIGNIFETLVFFSLLFHEGDCGLFMFITFVICQVTFNGKGNFTTIAF